MAKSKIAAGGSATKAGSQAMAYHNITLHGPPDAGSLQSVGLRAPLQLSLQARSPQKPPMASGPTTV